MWIGTNAVIVGGIEIGDDVLIAPGAFVNVDVPSGSTVIGNPAWCTSTTPARASTSRTPGRAGALEGSRADRIEAL